MKNPNERARSNMYQHNESFFKTSSEDEMCYENTVKLYQYVLWRRFVSSSSSFSSFSFFVVEWMNEWKTSHALMILFYLFGHLFTCFCVLLFFDIWFFWRSFEEEFWSLNFWKFHIFLRRKRLTKSKSLSSVVIARTLVVVRSAPAWFWIAKRVRSVVVSKRSSFEERSSSSRLLCWWRRVGGVGGVGFFVCVRAPLSIEEEK